MVITGSPAEHIGAALLFVLQSDHGWLLAPEASHLPVRGLAAECFMFRGPAAGFSFTWTLDAVLLRYSVDPSLMLSWPRETARKMVDDSWGALWDRAGASYMVKG